MLNITNEGALLMKTPFYKKAEYDMSNQVVLAQGDGAFNISKFSIAGFGEIFKPNSFYTSIRVDGTAVSSLVKKEVTMLGRSQKTKVEENTLYQLEQEIFLDDKSSSIYMEFKGKAKEALVVDFGFLCANEGIADKGIAVETNGELTFRERQDVGLHYTVTAVPNDKDEVILQVIFTHCQESKEIQTEQQFSEKFYQGRVESEEYINKLIDWAKNYKEEEKVLFISCLNCGLSAYKEVGNFKGFFAGVNYQTPLRTYYRDGYFTAISVLPFKPELVRNQLLTLAMGIEDNGQAPSAVIDENNMFWENHLDSPQYFVILLWDYIKATGDFNILWEKVKKHTLLQAAYKVLQGLLNKLDSKNLLYREAGNRHDWADNIFREGYVTYIEALLYRALICGMHIFSSKATGNIEEFDGYGEQLKEKAFQVKRAINEELWLEDKGWYVNYKSDDCVEDNLSIDTVLLVLFGAADEEKGKIMIGNMERLLETRNNREQILGDWGTMCCYPFYKYKSHLVEKSSYDFSYHNGSDWPYWSCIYGFAKTVVGLKGDYPLKRWFQYSLENNWCTPVEYFSPTIGKGSLLQGWSATGAFALHFITKGENPFEI